ncbi:PREDICTED: poly [ADP-ribose] polymerase 14-like [Gekko japonicus]|uniref:Poly [ADP-ribose] polymerase 14-like n=1 Tax=Gekko japonicus TaxID=146911 RepID=A0ABM1LEV4_GEKJA|nr:PREDICTED: poly [ADP-ribose] polymerase 14-like [Gekko japonicus]
MAEEGAFLFPVLVAGNWSSSLNTSLKNKLLRYFQSPKRSGGGECRIHVELWPEEHVTVYFAEDEVRQRVLGMKTHELILPGEEKLKLTVSLPAVTTDENESQQEPGPIQESIQVNQLQESSPNFKSADSDLQAKGKPGVFASQSETDISAMIVSEGDQALQKVMQET